MLMKQTYKERNKPKSLKFLTIIKRIKKQNKKKTCKYILKAFS